MEVVKLLAKGADKNLKNKVGERPFDLATTEEIRALLK